MSIKVYVAYRLKESVSFWSWLPQVRRNALNNVQEVLRDFHNTLKEVVKTEGPPEYQGLLAAGWTPEQAAAHIAEVKLTHGFRDQLGKAERDLYDFNVSLEVRCHRPTGRLYVLPTCDTLMRHTLDFLKNDSALEDAAFWNNIDKPDNVPMPEWQERERIWEDLMGFNATKYDASLWDDVVIIPVCDWASFWKVKPFMSDALDRAEKKRKTGELEGH